MNEMIYYSELYDLYKTLLTNKQKQYFEDYYFKNLSFGEIAENYRVSRNAIFNQLKLTKDLLKEYENKLKLKQKLEKIEKKLDNNIYKQVYEIIFE